MTLVAVLCCAMTMTVLTSCTKDKDKFVYTIKAEPGGLMNGIEAGNWRNSVMSVYQAALDTDKNGGFLAVIEISLYFSPLEKLLSLERTKKNEFSFGSLLAYS